MLTLAANATQMQPKCIRGNLALSCPSLPPLLSPDRVALSPNNLGLPQSVLANTPHTLGLPQLTLQHTLHTLGLSLHMQHRLMFVWFNPDHPLHHPFAHTHTHTELLKKFYYETPLHT